MAIADIPSIAPPGPGGRLFQAYNALTQANLANAKQALMNQYYPALTQAEVAQKTSPMALYGPQAGALSYINALKQGQNPQPQIAQPQQSESPIMQLAHGVQHLFGGGAPSQSNAVAPGAMPNGADGGPFGPGAPSQPNPVASPAEQARIANQGNQAPAPSSGEDSSSGMDQYGGYSDAGPPGSMGYGIKYPAAQEIYKEEKKTAAHNEAQQLNQFQTEAQDFQKTAPIIKANLDRLKEATSKLDWTQQGPIAGHFVPKWLSNSDRQVAMNAQDNLINSIVPLINSGHPSDQGLELAKKLKAGIELNPHALDEIEAYTNAFLNRGQEMLPFLTRMKDAGARSDHINNGWNNYQRQEPFYNAKAHKNTSYHDYTRYSGSQALKELKTKGKIEAYTRYKVPGEARVLRVPKENEEKFLSDNPNAQVLK